MLDCLSNGQLESVMESDADHDKAPKPVYPSSYRVPVLQIPIAGELVACSASQWESEMSANLMSQACGPVASNSLSRPSSRGCLIGGPFCSDAVGHPDLPRQFALRRIVAKVRMQSIRVCLAAYVRHVLL